MVEYCLVRRKKSALQGGLGIAANTPQPSLLIGREQAFCQNDFHNLYVAANGALRCMRVAGGMPCAQKKV